MLNGDECWWWDDDEWLRWWWWVESGDWYIKLREKVSQLAPKHTQQSHTEMNECLAGCEEWEWIWEWSSSQSWDEEDKLLK